MRLHAENDREFLDVIKGFSVTQGELAAIVKLPELSIREVKRYVHGGNGNRPQRTQSSAAHSAR